MNQESSKSSNLHVIDGSEIPLQVFSKEYVPETFEKAINTISVLKKKPRGGLWTSTFDERRGSAWIQFCKNSSLRDYVSTVMTLIVAKKGKKFIFIDSQEDTDILFAMYGRQVSTPCSLYQLYLPRFLGLNDNAGYRLVSCRRSYRHRGCRRPPQSVRGLQGMITIDQ